MYKASQCTIQHKWVDGYRVKTGKYLKFTSRGCELIPIEIDRLEYMLKYIIKNEYIKRANTVQKGNFIPKWKHEDIIKMLSYRDQHDEISVTINGHRYNVT